MSDVTLAILWHQHQPYYPDDVSGETLMPWVRLHGTKDYYGMALHLREYPEMRCTINLVPSLVAQLLAYTERGATDRPLQAARLPAGRVEVIPGVGHFGPMQDPPLLAGAVAAALHGG
jgi:alpha-amylase/alpha-mannosidase (GH57 family)